VQLHSFENGTSQHFKCDNWAQLQRVCRRQDIALPEPLVAGTMAGAHGAAVALMTHLYQVFTGKRCAGCMGPRGRHCLACPPLAWKGPCRHATA
jgi:hypothetical protein